VRIFADVVPYGSRGTLHFDLRAAVLSGVFLGAAQLMTMFVKKSLDAPDWQVALLVSAPMAGHLFSFYWGYLAHRRRKMSFVLWPGLISRGLFLLVGFLSNSLALVLVVALSWFIGSIIFPAVSAIYRVNYPGHRRYRAVGLVLLLNHVAIALTGLLLGRALDMGESNYRWVFPLAGLVGMAGILLFARIKVRDERDLEIPESEPFSLRSVVSPLGKSLGVLFKDRAFGLYMIGQFAIGSCYIATLPALIKLLDEMEISWSDAGAVLVTVKSLGIIVSLVFWSHLLQKLDPFRVRLLACSLVLLGLFLLVMARDVGLVYVAQAVLGLAFGGGTLMWNLAQTYFARKHDVSLYTGTHATLTGIRALTAPFLGAALLSWMSPRGVFLVAMAGYVLSMLYLGVLLVLKVDKAAHGSLETRSPE